MDLTEGTFQEKKNRAKKMMLWFAIISLTMSFAGLTSAVVVSSSRPDWLVNYSLPFSFTLSSILIVFSSLFMIIYTRSVKSNKPRQALFFVITAFILGVLFIFNQISGFDDLINNGYYFTGPSSNVTISYIYIIAFWHILHVVVGLIALLFVIYNQFKQNYNSREMLGVELASTYWHFVDVLWLLLFLFFNFFR
jgi:cytochrome c oxidase subunit III